MKLEDSIIRADYQNNWLIYTSHEELKVVPKDYIIVRWLKIFIQILFCCYCDVYGHIQVDRVVQGIWEMYKKEIDAVSKPQKKDTTFVTNLHDRVYQLLWKLPDKKLEEVAKCQEKYLTLVINLLDCNLGKMPIKTHRQCLMGLERRIKNYGNEILTNLRKIP